MLKEKKRKERKEKKNYKSLGATNTACGLSIFCRPDSVYESSNIIFPLPP